MYRLPERLMCEYVRTAMSRTPFQLRMDDDRLERLRRVAATMKMSKAEIIEAAIDVRLDMLEGYVKLDTAPTKAVRAGKVADKPVVVRTQPKVKHLKPTDDLRSNLGQTRSVRGYAIDGSPIYR